MGKATCIFVIAMISLLVILIWGVLEQRHYKEEHQCINIGEAETALLPQYIFGSKGQIVGVYFIPATTFMYQCDNGKKRF